MTRVSVLTPPGTGAIATVEVRGPDAWVHSRRLFRPVTPAQPESPQPLRVWFGRLGDGGDEVLLAVRQVEPEPVVEIHCHGGRRVVHWVVEQFTELGCEKVTFTGDNPWAVLARARTLRTAAIILDQCHGAFDRAGSDALAALDRNDPAALSLLERLASFGPVGRHLVEPWRVVVAGAPNVGKSSLVNALAGYQRAVVSDVAGTTRDVVTVPVAFDGWPVELADTAGLRRAAESLEAEGIALARDFLASADLVVWVLDATEPEPVHPAADPALPRVPLVLVANKSDRPLAWDADRFAALSVSAATGSGIATLTSAVVSRLVPHSPPPGAAVPYTPSLAGAIDTAVTSLRAGNATDTRRILAPCLTPLE